MINSKDLLSKNVSNLNALNKSAEITPKTKNVSKEDFFRLTRAFFAAISGSGAKFSKVYFCPHSESEQCECRKPNIGLFKRAVQEMNIDLANSFMIGDMSSDIQAGINFGIRTILVQSAAVKESKFTAEPNYRSKNLLEAARLIVSLTKV